MGGNRQLFSRRTLLRGAGIVATCRLDTLGMQNAAGYGVTALLDGTGMTRIPPGEFQMGSPNGNADERPVHRVRISQGFEIGKCEVTQAQWEAVMGNAHVAAGATVVNTDGAGVSRSPSRFKGASLPVDSVSWVDVALFLERLNARDSRYVWRLPTEAEWEYACKAGGAHEAGLGTIAWYKANSDDQTQPVATKEPNAWGLDDFDIIVHCHWEFDFPSALAFAKALAPIEPWWLEDPMPIKYVDTWTRLAAASPVPILCGENLYTRHDFLPFITNGAVDMIMIDISMAGGLLEAKRIADLANAYYLPIATHNVMGPVATIASANCAATMHDFAGHESMDFKTGSRAGEGDLIIYDREIIQDGHIQLSDKPGLGLDINRDVAMKHILEGETWWG